VGHKVVPPLLNLVSNLNIMSSNLDVVHSPLILIKYFMHPISPSKRKLKSTSDDKCLSVRLND
jgi:hypothetical protein